MISLRFCHSYLALRMVVRLPIIGCLLRVSTSVTQFMFEKHFPSCILKSQKKGNKEANISRFLFVEKGCHTYLQSVLPTKNIKKMSNLPNPPTFRLTFCWKRPTNAPWNSNNASCIRTSHSTSYWNLNVKVQLGGPQHLQRFNVFHGNLRVPTPMPTPKK